MTENLKKKFSLLEMMLHICVWILVFIIPQYLLILQEEPSNSMYLFIFLKTVFYALIFYLNYFVLIPLLFFKQKRILYYVTALLSVLVIFYFSEEVGDMTRPRPPDFDKQELLSNGNEIIHENFMPDDGPMRHRPPPKWQFLYNNLITLLLVSATGLGLRFAKKIQETERLRKEAEKEKLNTELVLLKSQIHPHFFFNTLNNIYALTEAGSADASKAILKLSRLMRYVIYESETETTMLSKEIDFLKNYIDLMRLRLTGKVTLDVRFPDDYTDTEIQPLLFITFIENAFKHGISYNSPSFISIVLNVSSDNIEFLCRNSIIDIPDEIREERTGLGLENVKKRLDMLYPGKHQLTIVNENSVFEVNLKLITGNEISMNNKFQTNRK
jgi:two-component system, LytTR family, sensor kinase